MNIFKTFLSTLLLTSALLIQANNDSLLMQQELPTDPNDELGFLVRFSVDEEEQTSPAPETPSKMVENDTITMFDILRFAFTGCAHLYLTLDNDEKDDVIKMASELISLRSMVEEYCDTCLKYNDLMMKYKSYRNIESMSMNASIGCQSCDDVRADSAEPFSMKAFLEDEMIQKFYVQLDRQEQKQYKRIVRGMEEFCHDVVRTIGIIIDHYPSLKTKMKDFLNNEGLMMMLNISFDHPFPSVTYQVL